MNRLSNVFVPAVISPAECDDFVRSVMTLPTANGDMYGPGESAEGQDDKLPGVRSSTIRWVYRNNPQFAWVFDRLFPLVETANASSFGYVIDNLTSLQFTEYYSERLGQYQDHIDLFVISAAETDRKLSFVVQLTDPSSYVGGDLHIHCDNHPDPTALRQQGAMVMFHSFLQHKIRPVTHGFRYSLVGWVEGPRLQ